MHRFVVNDTDFSDRCVLVTGGAGFIGSHLAHALSPANEVRVLDDFSRGRRERVPDGVDVLEGDVRDGELLDSALAGVDCVFHTAGLSRVVESVERPVESHDRNSLGTVKLLEAACEHDARVVFSSSAAIYGRPSSIPIHESDSKSPRSPYGVDKLAADRYTRLFDELYGLDTISLRYFNVYGPLPEGGVGGGVVRIFLERARRGAPLQIEGDGSQCRDFVHVRDVVQANLRAATADASGRAYNVGTGESTTIERLARTIQRLVDADPPIVYEDPRQGDVDQSSADVTRIREELDYEPTVTLEEGLAGLAEE
jgi:UDP-glucose 4-epimerase